MKDNIKYSESYLSAVYDYYLDLIIYFIKYKSHGVYDKRFKYTHFDYNIIDKTFYYAYKQSINFPFNEKNDYYKIQNYKNIFKLVCKDLSFQISKRENGYAIIFKNDEYDRALEHFNMIDESFINWEEKYYGEEIYQALNFIYASNFYKEGKILTSNISIEYNDETNLMILKNDNESYVQLNIHPSDYDYFINNLIGRLEMFNYTVFYNNDKLKIFTHELPASRKDFSEYYSYGIKLTKRN